jgi:hypothetical protein
MFRNPEKAINSGKYKSIAYIKGCNDFFRLNGNSDSHIPSPLT